MLNYFITVNILAILEISDSSQTPKFHAEKSPALGKVATPKSTSQKSATPGKHPSLISPQPSPRQSRSLSLVSSPVISKSVESSRHGSVDSIKGKFSSLSVLGKQCYKLGVLVWCTCTYNTDTLYLRVLYVQYVRLNASRVLEVTVITSNSLMARNKVRDLLKQAPGSYSHLCHACTPPPQRPSAANSYHNPLTVPCTPLSVPISGVLHAVCSMDPDAGTGVRVLVTPIKSVLTS